MLSMTVYRIDPKTMLLMYPETVAPQPDGEFIVPGNCVQLAPPDCDGLDRPRWDSDVPVVHARFGFIDTGSWSVVKDFRRTKLYLTSDGSEYTLDQEIDEQTYTGIGDLPAWLTTDPRPSPYHHYADGAWVLDEAEELTAVKQQQTLRLAMACQNQIYAGFTSAALGAVHQYPAQDKDQQNLTASVLDSTVPGLPTDWTTPFWCADVVGDWDFRLHTAEQIQQVGREGKLRILACMAHNKELATQVLNATDKAAALAVVWTDSDDGQV